ncbi:MAG: hypothetical protein ABID87_06710 [Chloroflexota bacterium]
MANGEYIFLIIVGGVFLLLGLAAMFWGQREEKGYFNDLATRADDLREFMDHWPSRPQPGALKLGGWLAITIGILLGVLGLILLLLNQGAI